MKNNQGRGPASAVPDTVPADRLTIDWACAAPFLGLGGVAILVGGLISAGTASVAGYSSAWAVAYLVLVVGVAQIAFGVGQAWLSDHRPSPRLRGAQFLAYNVGNVGVLLGTLSGNVWMVDVGGLLLVAALALFLRGVRSTTARGGWALVAYRGLLLIILISVPVGLVLVRR